MRTWVALLNMYKVCPSNADSKYIMLKKMVKKELGDIDDVPYNSECYNWSILSCPRCFFRHSSRFRLSARHHKPAEYINNNN